MKNAELIVLVKDDLFEVVYKEAISVTEIPSYMAYILFLYNEGITTDEDIFSCNNVYAIKDKTTKNTVIYPTIADCISAGRMAAGGLSKSLRNKYDKYKNIYIDENNLNDLENEYLAAYPDTIIDLDEYQKEPSVNQYEVVTPDGIELLKTSSKKEALQLQEETEASDVLDSRARIISSKKPKINNKAVISSSLEPRSKIECTNVNLYYEKEDAYPGRLINGTFYIYDGILHWDKYAICATPDCTGVVGYIKKSDILQ